MLGAHKAAILGAADAGPIDYGTAVLYAPLDETSGWQNDITETALTAEGNGWTSSTSGPPTGMSRYAVTNASANSNFVSDITINGNSNWTIEVYYKHVTAAPGGGIRCSGGQTIGYYTDGNNAYLWVNATNADSDPVSFSAGTWYHLAFMRSGSTIYCFKDGVQVMSAAFAGTAMGTSCTAEIGYRASSNSGSANAGYSSWRVHPSAFYSTSGFTPPTLPLY